MSILAMTTKPIFFSQMLDAYMAQAYPLGTVLVCMSSNDGQFDIDMLEHAFGEEGMSDVCRDIADVFVICFPEEVTAEVIMAQLQSSAAEMENDDSSCLGDIFRIYINGASVPI